LSYGDSFALALAHEYFLIQALRCGINQEFKTSTTFRFANHQKNSLTFSRVSPSEVIKSLKKNKRECC